MEMNDPWEGSSTTWSNLFGMQAGDRGFNDFLSRRFTDSAETERIHDEMCQQIVDMLTGQDAGEARAYHPGRHRQPHLVQRPDH